VQAGLSFLNNLLLRVRLLQKIFLPIVITCLLLVAVTSTTPGTEGAGTGKPLNTEQCYSAASTHLNREGERPVPVRYSGSIGYSTGHAAAGKVLQWALLPGTGSLPVQTRTSCAAVYISVAHGFVPLLRLLLFPKHWFW